MQGSGTDRNIFASWKLNNPATERVDITRDQFSQFETKRSDSRRKPCTGKARILSGRDDMGKVSEQGKSKIINI